MTGGGYSCKTARETLEWIVAIKDFLEPYRFFLDAHVVNFFTDKLWEAVDKEWMDCLRRQPVQHLLQIPSGVVQNNWPASLKEFVCTVKALSLPREQADLQEAFPGLNVAALNDVISQGMNRKKKHEIESLASVIGLIAKRVGADTVVDVGSGQGYLSQVLSFENELSVIAIDASSHHGSITDARAKRIKKYYEAKMRKSWTFVECEEVKSVVSIGCCYNLLSEKGFHEADSQSGFPMSKGANSAGLLLGKSARDLACQSADRWKGLGEIAALHNFELHAFRSAFQMVLLRYYPEIMIQSPAIGRQGKALRRQHHRRILESDTGSIGPTDALAGEGSSYPNYANEETNTVDRYSMFVKFCQSGLSRLGHSSFHDIDFSDLWEEAKPFSELIGPYWTLRAALGPILETVLMLDRLLFLQEQGDLLEAVMLPIFNPVLSPRNVALIAKKL